jgi:hypothetical protein
VRWYLLKQVLLQKESKKIKIKLIAWHWTEVLLPWNWANATVVSKVSQLKFGQGDWQEATCYQNI